MRNIHSMYLYRYTTGLRIHFIQSRQFPLNYYLKNWDPNSIPFSETTDSSDLRIFLNIKTNYSISLPINSISISEAASVIHLLVAPLPDGLFTT